jgi:signal transduction histidine kinase
VYGYGLVLLLAVAASVGMAAKVLYDGPAWGDTRRITKLVDAELSPLLDRPEELQAKLARLDEAFEVDAAVFAADGTRLAAAGRALEPLEQVPREASVVRRGATHHFAVPLDGGRAYAVASRRMEGGGGRWWLMFGVVLLVLALVSAPLARGIVRPLEKVTRTARALGEGDLSARTGLRRGDEVGDLARAIDDMASRLERLVASEKELLANVSHELRTPLARIRVALELAEEDAREGDDASGRHLAGIAGDLVELEDLVEQVLMTARLDLASGPESALPLRATETDPAALIGEAAERFTMRHAGHRLELDLADDLGMVVADPRLVKRVLANLLDNAAKYADTEEGAIVVTAEADEDDVTVSVRDHGIGVSDENLSKLFEPFFRTDESRERGTGGVGLGLALCRRIVEAHGGRIEAVLPDGGGLEVRFNLPRG